MAAGALPGTSARAPPAGNAPVFIPGSRTPLPDVGVCSLRRRRALSPEMLASSSSASYCRRRGRRTSPEDLPRMENADDKLLTVKEAAARLRVHPNTLRKWIGEGKVPHLRCGGPHGVIRLRWADLVADSRIGGSWSALSVR